MRIGSDGCNRVCDHGQEQKQGKKSAEWAKSTCFAMYVQGQKMQHVAKDDCGAQRGSRGGTKGMQGGHIMGRVHNSNEKARKKTKRQNETTKRGRTNM